MVDDGLEMRKEQGRGIQTFLDSHKEWAAKQYTFNEGEVFVIGKALVISKGSRVFDPELLRAMVAYQKGNVQYENRSSLGREDCAQVVSGFNQTFNGPDFAAFRQSGYASSYLSVGSDAGEVIPFYRATGAEGKGVKWHMVNMIENYGRKEYAAVDLTARYNMDIEQGTMDVFVVVGSSVAELKRVLKTITGEKWEVEQLT